LFLVVFSFDIAKIHIKLKNNKENMKITRYFKAFALSGRQGCVRNNPGRLPWARSFCPFRACGAYLLKLNQFRFYKSAAKIHFLIETAKEF